MHVSRWLIENGAEPCSSLTPRYVTGSTEEVLSWDDQTQAWIHELCSEEGDQEGALQGLGCPGTGTGKDSCVFIGHNWPPYRKEGRPRCIRHHHEMLLLVTYSTSIYWLKKQRSTEWIYILVEVTTSVCCVPGPVLGTGTQQWTEHKMTLHPWSWPSGARRQIIHQCVTHWYEVVNSTKKTINPRVLVS